MINLTSSIWSVALAIGTLFSTYNISPEYGSKVGVLIAVIVRDVPEVAPTIDAPFAKFWLRGLVVYK